MLREAEACRALGISEQSYSRCRKEYDGMQVSQTEKLEGLELQNARLKELIADQAPWIRRYRRTPSRETN